LGSNGGSFNRHAREGGHPESLERKTVFVSLDPRLRGDDRDNETIVYNERQLR
jgi:hypothetical protein